MNDDVFNMSIRKYLKMVGISSQREIEQAVSHALASGRLAGSESLPATMTLRIDRLGLDLSLDGTIDLE